MKLQRKPVSLRNICQQVLLVRGKYHKQLQHRNTLDERYSAVRNPVVLVPDDLMNLRQGRDRPRESYLLCSFGLSGEVTSFGSEGHIQNSPLGASCLSLSSVSYDNGYLCPRGRSHYFAVSCTGCTHLEYRHFSASPRADSWRSRPSHERNDARH